MKLKETTTGYRIADLITAERPRERLAQEGADKLRLAEVLAILLRVGQPGENAVQMGDRLLSEMGGLEGLRRRTYDELCALKGLGPAKAAQILAAIELGRRISQLSPEARTAIHDPEAAADLVRYEMSALEQEELRVILLDTRNHVLRIQTVNQGSLNMSLVRVGEIFKHAIRINAAGVIILHNHPSGDPTPSPEDVALTRAIVQAGRLLDVDVLDHLVIGGGQFVSLKQKGLGFA